MPMMLACIHYNTAVMTLDKQVLPRGAPRVTDLSKATAVALEAGDAIRL
jgi:hypothetical protein